MKHSVIKRYHFQSYKIIYAKWRSCILRRSSKPRILIPGLSLRKGHLNKKNAKEERKYISSGNLFQIEKLTERVNLPCNPGRLFVSEIIYYS